MNYIQQINLFEQWAEINMPSTGQYALYYALLALNNRSGWKEWFKVANVSVTDRIGMTPQGVRKARSYLIDRGLIEIQMVGSNKATLYKMTPLTNEIVSANYSTSGIVTARVTTEVDLSLEKLPQQFPVLKPKQDLKTETKDTATTADIHTKVFGTLFMPGLMSEYIMSLKIKGYTDAFIQELMLETGESGNKPSLRLMQTIGERWMKDGIYTRMEAKQRKHASRNVIPLIPKQDIDHLPTAAEIRAAEEERMKRSREERDLMFER